MTETPYMDDERRKKNIRLALLLGGLAEQEQARVLLFVDQLEELYTLVEDDPRPEVLHQRWRAIGAQFLLSGTVVRAGGLPRCTSCDGVVKPDITFFGEMLPAGALEQAYALAADLLRRNLGGAPRRTRFEGDGGGDVHVLVLGPEAE